MARLNMERLGSRRHDGQVPATSPSRAIAVARGSGDPYRDRGAHGNAANTSTLFYGVIMKKVFIATAMLAASFSTFAEGEAYANPTLGSSGASRAQVLQNAAGPVVSGELGYSSEAPALTAISRSRAATSTMGASAEAAPPQEAPLTRAKVRAELGTAVYKGQLGFGEFGAAPTRGSMGSQIIGQ
jgi:hypothetical protein